MERQTNLWPVICLVLLLLVELVSGACEKDCKNDNDCVDSEACIDSKCSDPCENEECGLNTICTTEEHVARCQCPVGLYGDPKVRCTNKCSSKDDCYEQEGCVDGTCLYPCYPRPCGKAAFCQSINQQANCSCPKGYTGDPLEECFKVCDNDKDCPDSRACTDNQCADPCDKKSCGLNAVCITEDHEAHCICQDGLVGDPQIRCNTVCKNNKDCFYAEQCIKGACLFPCFLDVCGTAAVCEVYDQKVKCKCPPNYTGDPNVKCHLNCQNNNDCLDSEACIDSKCSDPCEYEQCGLNTICTTKEHEARCQCPVGLYGDPKVRCTNKCSSKDDCYEQEGCVDGTCLYPCYRKPCGKAAFCQSINQQGNCSCPKGYTGDPLEECFKVCDNDKDCPDSRACIGNQCADPCDKKSCGLNAVCITEDHEAQCICQDGLVGDPQTRCNTVCKKNEDCFYAEQCIEGACQFSCFLDVCGIAAVCEIYDQTVKCKCPPNHTGDPNEKCYRICQDNSTCADDQVCLNEKCQDPCQDPKNPCGECAGCEVKGREAKCVCPKGYNGNATDVCRTGKGCLWNSDCDKSEACIDRLCRDPCQYKKCGDKATCGVKLHIAKCYCREGYEGIVEPFCRKGLH